MSVAINNEKGNICLVALNQNGELNVRSKGDFDMDIESKVEDAILKIRNLEEKNYNRLIGGKSKNENASGERDENNLNSGNNTENLD